MKVIQHRMEKSATSGFVATARRLVIGSDRKQPQRHLSMVGYAREICTAATEKVTGGTWAAATIVSSQPDNGCRPWKSKACCCGTKISAGQRWLKVSTMQVCHASALSWCSVMTVWRWATLRDNCEQGVKTHCRDSNGHGSIFSFLSCRTLRPERS